VTAASAAEGAGQAHSRRRIKAAYERRRYQQKRAGTWSPFTSTAPVREHLDQLYSSGMTQEQISRVAGVSVTAMYRAASRPRMSTAAGQALLAVQPIPDTAVSGDRQAGTASLGLRALVADGWTLLQLADATGLSARTIGRTVHGRSTPLPATAAAISGAHDVLCCEDPGDGAAATHSRRRAARAGWQPSTLPPEADDVDSVAVHRAVNGELVSLRSAERQVVLHRLAGEHPDHEIGHRIGVSSRTVLRHRTSQNLPAYQATRAWTDTPNRQLGEPAKAGSISPGIKGRAIVRELS